MAIVPGSAAQPAIGVQVLEVWKLALSAGETRDAPVLAALLETGMVEGVGVSEELLGSQDVVIGDRVPYFDEAAAKAGLEMVEVAKIKELIEQRLRLAS